MNSMERLDQARSQLELVLSFFNRAETKLSVLLGIDLAMLGFLGTTVSLVAGWGPDLWAAILSLICIGMSVWNLYGAAAPQMSGGERSLVYFREIASREEDSFVKLFGNQSAEALADDLLRQAWRNACILRRKFECLDRAFRWTAIAIIPWFAWIVLSTME